MSTERKSESIPAGGMVIVPAGNFFFLEKASDLVTVRFDRRGTTFGAANVPAGYTKREPEPWDRCVIMGNPGVAVTYYIGYEIIGESDTDFRQQLANVAGELIVRQSLAPSFTAGLKQTIAPGTHVDLPARSTQITIFVWPASNGLLTVRDTGGTADAGAFVQPGTFESFPTSAPLRLRNNSTAAIDYSTWEA